MQLDSHRRQLSSSRPVYVPIISTQTPPAYQPPTHNVTDTSSTMPCQFSRFRPRLTFASPDPAASPAVGALDAYVANRRTWLYLLRRQTRILVFLFVFLEAIWRGPTELVFGKDFDPKIDYGFVYNVGYFFTWIWTCLFAIIWAAFFEVRLDSFPDDEANET